MNKKMNNKGFSLVELIIVIAIMAVLVGVLAPQFLKYVERSRKSTDVQTVAEIISAVNVYAADPSTTDVAVSTNYTIQLSTTANDLSSATTCATQIKNALENAGIHSVVLKSKDWSTSGTITLTAAVAADGSVTYSSSDTTSTKDIVKGLYK
jgi:type IV pilus assembly protein PilA